MAGMLMLCINFANAVASATVSQDLNGLIGQINKVNDDINNKQKQEQHLSRAINDSDEAIDRSQELLDHLKAQRELDIKQLDEIETVLPILTQATESAGANMKLMIEQTYKQLRQLQSNNSIIGGNDILVHERQKKYLVKILELEQKKNIELQSKLEKLTALNNKITAELNRVDSQLGTTTKHKSKLEKEKEAKLAEATKLQQNISQERKQLSNLKEQQAQLNKLLQNLRAMEIADKAKLNKDSSKQLAISKGSSNYEDNSPFLSRQLSKPVEAGAAIVKFGEVRGRVTNNGILFKASNTPIHAISNGRVLYAGVLPGFGQMVVVDNGDNYTSIYGGILPTVTKNQKVTSNQVIGSSGVLANQPMGGVYFELRHLGKPVNPSKLE